jgi:hypothetical protein
VQDETGPGHEPEDDVDLGQLGIVAVREFSDTNVVEVLVVAWHQEKGHVTDDGCHESPEADEELPEVVLGVNVMIAILADFHKFCATNWPLTWKTKVRIVMYFYKNGFMYIISVKIVNLCSTIFFGKNICKIIALVPVWRWGSSCGR